jgi:hypothetical protein
MTDCSINPVTKKPQCNKWGYHALPNGTGFDSLDFGLPKNSPFQHTTFRTAFDVQHTDCKGNMEHSVLGFCLLLKQGKSTGDEQQSEEFLVFSKATKEIVEKAMLIWGSLYQCQSNHSLPRTYFPQGPLSTDKLNCHEYPGLVLLYLTFLCSTLGDMFLGTYRGTPEANKLGTYTRRGWLGDDLVSKWSSCLEGSLLHDSFLCCNQITNHTVKEYNKHLPSFLDLNSVVVATTTKAKPKSRAKKLPKGRRTILNQTNPVPRVVPKQKKVDQLVRLLL